MHIKVPKIPDFYFTIFLLFILHAGYQCYGYDSAKVSFIGQHTRIKYTKNRQIKEIAYILKNNTPAELTVKLGNSYLVRGKSEELLEKVCFRYFQNNHIIRSNEITLRPNQKLTVYCTFKPFTIYTGSIYSIRTELYVGDEKYKAVSTIELYKLEKNDPNMLKNSKQK